MTTNPDAICDQGPFFPNGDPVWALRHDGPLHGDILWDFSGLVTRTSQGDRRLDLADIAEAYRGDVETILGILAHPDHPHVIEAGVIRAATAAPTSTVVDKFRFLRTITRWASAHSLPTFADWTASDADTFLDALRDGTHRDQAEGGIGASSVRQYIATLRLARTFSPALRHPFSFMPWGGRTAAEVAGEEETSENVTPPIAWATWAPLVAGAWAFVDRFSVDVLAANETSRAQPAEPRGVHSWPVFRQWARDGGLLPLATGFGRAPLGRGTPNLRLLCRSLGISDNFLCPSHNAYRPEATRIVCEMVDDVTRHTYGGLITPTVNVTHPDGTTTPWISELGRGELEYLISALRGACYVIIAALTGMRDSEIQDMRRDAITVVDGLDAITSVQTKGRRHPVGETRTWWAPKPVARAVGVLRQASRHPTHLFARHHINAGNYKPTRDIRRLVDFINGDPAERPGRGHGLALPPIAAIEDGAIHATSLRRAFSVYAVTKPGAELGLGIQLGHSAWRLVSGYASDGRQIAASQMDESRRAILREQAAGLLAGGAPLAGTPAVNIREFRAQIVADPERAARITEQVADRLHLGLTNDCMYNPATSGCGSDGPHLADHYCIGSDCANALFGPAHLPVITNAIDRIDLALDNPRGNKDLQASMGRNRQNLARLRRELTSTKDDD